MKKRTLQKRILWLLFLVAVYCLGQFIIIPFVSTKIAEHYLRRNTLLRVIGMYTGAQTNRPSLLMLGIGPYMSANIVLQAITSLDIAKLRNMSAHDTGILINFLSLFFGILQGIMYAYNLRPALIYIGFFGHNVSFLLTTIVLIAGAMIAVFLANLNSEKGIGGSAMLMLPQLLVSLPTILKHGWGNGTYKFTTNNLIIVFAVVILLIPCGLILTRAEERLPLRNPMLTSNFAESFFPMRLLLGGAMPFMFSNTLFMLPRMLSGNAKKFKNIVLSLTSLNQVSGILFYVLIIIILNFIFGIISLQPSVKTRELKESGCYFYETVAGADTESFLLQHFIRLTWVSSLFLILISVWPLILGLKWHQLANLTPFIGNAFIIITIVYAAKQEYQTLNNERKYVINMWAKN
ncbi:hypothetical protein [Lactobacillus sp. ESL0703]|uniref:hypothetical protein n=1 Tax=Lactobacillus sp. ESL0703 TaxID=2983218 RepID=UPI0023F8E5AB|nr:hypothetical protein [Lactobacillus sp. ESL0703]MDF7668330.1 hypothetical protein [Lactobacillus sp. ESL0703]